MFYSQDACVSQETTKESRKLECTKPLEDDHTTDTDRTAFTLSESGMTATTSSNVHGKMVVERDYTEATDAHANKISLGVNSEFSRSLLLRILVVDDVLSNRKLLRRLLQNRLKLCANG